MNRYILLCTVWLTYEQSDQLETPFTLKSLFSTQCLLLDYCSVQGRNCRPIPIAIVLFTLKAMFAHNDVLTSRLSSHQ